MENSDDKNINEIESRFPKGLPFDIPDGYFSSLADKIQSRINIKDLSNPDEMIGVVPFTIPLNYFEKLADNIENKIGINENEIIPDDLFFENQKEDILSTINLNEKAGNIIPFEVPTDYFNKLTSLIESKTSLQQRDNRKQFIIYKWVYAAAAIILLSFGIGYFSNTRSTVLPTSVSFNTDSLSTADIVSKLEKSEITEEELIRNVDTKELTNQIKIEEKDVNNILEELDETDLTKDM